MHDRVDYASSMTDGRTVQGSDPKGRSAGEMAALWKFVKAKLHESTKGSSVKKAVPLSSNLVAIKGGAAPADDMPTRSATAPAEETGLAPLNFRVSAEFR